ncbi:MAG: TylF/MycF/NovP-related O-methyltransferase [bacterium]
MQIRLAGILARRMNIRVSRITSRWHGQPVSGNTLELLSDADRRIAAAVEPYTCTGLPRVAALIRAVRYLVRSRVAGAFVECGVWRGGSMMTIALTLLDEQAADRDLYLFDTFAGMTPPADRDIRDDGAAAQVILDTTPRRENQNNIWCFATEAEVRRNLARTGYPSDRIHFVKGRVEDTLPYTPELDIALLRLDTDWYESTKHELTHLYPRLSSGGVLIVDDYGDWQGAREAADEYLQDHPEFPILLFPIDHTGRIAIKVPANEGGRMSRQR